MLILGSVQDAGSFNADLYVMVIDSLYFEDFFSVLLVSYVMWSGALESLDLLLSHPAITLAYHISIILISTFKH